MQGNLITLLVSFTLSMGAFFAANHNSTPVQKIEFTKPIEIKAGEDFFDDGDSMNIKWMSSPDAQLLIHTKQN